jgi:hypothetical protein
VTLERLTPVAAFGGGIDLRHSVTSHDAYGTRVLFYDPLGHWNARMWLAQRFAPPSAIVRKTTIHVIPIVRIDGVEVDLWEVSTILPRLHTLTEGLLRVPSPEDVWELGVWMETPMRRPVAVHGCVVVFCPLAVQFSLR